MDYFGESLMLLLNFVTEVSESAREFVSNITGGLKRVRRLPGASMGAFARQFASGFCKLHLSCTYLTCFGGAKLLACVMTRAES